jgi:alpha-glucuronidase
MLTQEYGSVFIAFTGVHGCKKCNNQTYFQIRQEYIKQTAMLIPLGSSYTCVYKFCPVCEAKDYIIKSKLFASKEKWSEIYTLLNEGREYTKNWILKLDYKEQEQALKRLNSLKAYDLVKYISGR